jgi:CBS domain-containing protein
LLFSEAEITPVPLLKEIIMRTTGLLELRASDVMTREVIRLREEMPLWEAAALLSKNQIGGAPVVDGHGKCVGVLSGVDFVRLAMHPGRMEKAASAPLPAACPFQLKHRVLNGHETTLCILPLGACPVQVVQEDADGQKFLACSQPHCVLADWQVVDVEKAPADEVRHFMTADPVMVGPDTPLRIVARLMIDAHVHRVIVADEARRPIGIVSGTDILAAVAYLGDEQWSAEDGRSR